MNRRILIIDDDPNVLEMLSFMLGRAGFGVLTAKAGRDGITIAGEERPDLVILDLMMPEVDGLEVCRALKRDPRTALIPIVMLTAKRREVDRTVGLELGADDYIPKPFDVQEVIRRVAAIVQVDLEEAPPCV